MLGTGTLIGKSNSDRLAWLGACYHVVQSHRLLCESPRIPLSPPPQLWGYKWQPIHPGFLYGFWGFELRALCYVERTLPTKPSPQPLDISLSLIKNVYHSYFIEKECGAQRQQTTFPKSHRDSYGIPWVTGGCPTFTLRLCCCMTGGVRLNFMQL